MYTTNEINAEATRYDAMDASELYDLITDRSYQYDYLAARELGRVHISKYLKPAAEVKEVSDAVNLEAHVDILMAHIADMIEDAAKVGHNFIIISEESLKQLPNLYIIVETALEAQGYTLEYLETDTCPDGYGEFKSLCIPFYKISW